jgi:hypothetical protein
MHATHFRWSTPRAVWALLSSVLSLVVGPAAGAQFVTSPFASPTQVVSFSQFVAAETSLPQTIGIDASRPVKATVVAGAPAVFNQTYALGGYFPDEPALNDPLFCSNGEWNSARQGFLGLFPGSTVRVTFGGTAVRGVGAYMNYVPRCANPGSGSPVMRLLDVNNTVVATYDIDVLGRIVTPNALNAGAFRGAISNADFYGVEFSGAYLVLDDLAYVLSNDTAPPVTTTPEPASVLLTAAGLGSLAALKRRRRSRT